MKTWSDVMAQLTGARLAALDTLLRRGTCSLITIAEECPRHDIAEITSAVLWLRAHHFARASGPGIWDARSNLAAQNLFTAAGGPIEEFMREEAQPASASAPAVNVAQSSAPVHDHQTRMFADY